MFKLLGIFTFLLVCIHGLVENSNKGECSRFPYDHDILKKIIELEHDHEIMKYLLSRYQQLEDTNLETAKILQSQDALIRSLQTELQQGRQETKTRFGELEHAIATYGEQIEKSNATLHERWEVCSNDFADLQEELKSYGDQVQELKTKYSNLTVDVKYRDCKDVLTANKSARSGLYTIYPLPNLEEPGLTVYCDMTTQSGGWVVFQRRHDGSENFYRDWRGYKMGFGNLKLEFWLGLDNIYSLVSDGKWELLINLRDDAKGEKYATYKTFSVGPESGGYVLTIGDYSGDAGDSLNYHNGTKFTTKDRDNDKHSKNCAVVCTGAWWYKECCYSNLNGGYGVTGWQGTLWYDLAGTNSIEFVEMKMKRIL